MEKKHIEIIDESELTAQERALIKRDYVPYTADEEIFAKPVDAESAARLDEALELVLVKHLRIDKTLAVALEELARENGISAHALMRKVLAEYVEKRN